MLRRLLKFQHTAARRRLVEPKKQINYYDMFQHTAARRRLEKQKPTSTANIKFQHTAARRRLDMMGFDMAGALQVSTHSRPKAAGIRFHINNRRYRRFNTQPPEGGWPFIELTSHWLDCFNTQPPEGGWNAATTAAIPITRFQHTAARRRLDQQAKCQMVQRRFNTQPPEGGWRFITEKPSSICSVSTHSRPKAAGVLAENIIRNNLEFQHTAARRRLDSVRLDCLAIRLVSTHSRPKAAG